ncbi:family 20 glycosylhydrolase [Maribacter sp. TH_r10]|uniref:family 20 glycosylhydrolase n=1 Tax=Maribacter sp. TH_r10 TaxID=3082086 RepID=UPI002953359E|nr:family 20 glycosylhydrolase [Maribacter sp. TH_r10]MDV7139175.1 family 20 glycosylhydrolase [Maribacter sp. TH_r10]
MKKSITSTVRMAQRLLPLWVTILIISCNTPNPGFTEDDIAIIPKPLNFTLGEGSFEISAKTPLAQSDGISDKAVGFLNGLLGKAAGFTLEKSSGILEKGIVFITKEGFKNGGYGLHVNPDKITIEATEASGFFNAVQTIRQLLPKEIEQNGLVDTDWYVPSVDIQDEPRFEWRGMHNDFSRHFFDVDEVKQFLDYLALYKMNTYHMHLTDDQGWRMEIKKYPLLTEKGAWRIPNNQDTICNTRAVENDLYTIDPAKFKEVDGERKYGGFFTQEQIKEIISYADDRCITVIPEVDMPGHFKSAIDNYPFLSCNEESGWDTVFTYPTCLGKETTYEFMKNVLSEVVELFPTEYIHIGGDEVNIKSWEVCPHCQKVIADNGLKDEHELQSFFNRDIERFLHSKGKKLLGWDEIVEGGLTKDATVMWWRGWRPEAPKKAAEQGNDVIITTTDAYYFDYLNEGNPLEKIYNYEPVPKSFTEKEEANVLGIQANLWSEWIPSFKRLQYQAFPRMIAVAENAWAPKKSKDFMAFNTRVEKQYPRLEEMGVYYYIPIVKGLDKELAMVDSTKVKLDLAYPLEGVEIYYTTDGSVPTKGSLRYSGPFVVTDTVEIKARAYKGDIYNDIKKTKVIQKSYLDPVGVTPTEKGLKRFILKGKYKKVADLELNKGQAWQKVDSIDLADYKEGKRFNMVFSGYFHAEEDGIYEFETRSDGGDHLYIGDTLVVDNSGWHGPRKRYGKVALKSGWYPIVIKYRPSDNPRVINAWYGLQGEELHSINSEVTGH